MWYGSELLQHHDGKEEESPGSNSCVTIQLTEVTEQVRLYLWKQFICKINSEISQMTTIRPDHVDEAHHRGYYDQSRQHRNSGHKYNYLHLIWQENGVTLEYSLRYNMTRRGFWISSSPQKSKHTTFHENLMAKHLLFSSQKEF